jgi:hypothetical protein
MLASKGYLQLLVAVCVKYLLFALSEYLPHFYGNSVFFFKFP